MEATRGRDLAILRKGYGIRQERVAKRHGIGTGTLIDIERERLVPAEPSVENLAATVRVIALEDAQQRIASEAELVGALTVRAAGIQA